MRLASQNIIEYPAGKGFDAAGGSGGGMWGSWSKTPIFGLVQGRKPRYETEGYDYMELGIVGYEWSYTPGNGDSPFDQVMGDLAVSNAGSPIGEWGGSEAQQGIKIDIIDFSSVIVGENRGLHIKLGVSGNGGFSNLNWVQTVRTNRPNGKASSPYNDPQPSDDDLPFYHTNWQIQFMRNTEGYDLIFEDMPRRDGPTQYTYWQGELSLVGEKGGKYYILQTIIYGYEVEPGGSFVIYPITNALPSQFQTDTVNSLNH